MYLDIKLSDEAIQKITTIVNEEVEKRILEDEELIKFLKRDLLNKIGIKYINRAYEFRMNNENVAESCQVNNLSKMLKKWLKECEE